MYKKYIKRILDIILSLIAIIITLPIFLIVGILILIFIGQPAIFRQKRPGKNEKIFTMYKFRTMTNKKDEDGNLLPDELRLTKLGKFLRKTSLDEIPEFINILKGDMSFVGSRPLLVEYLPYYTEEEHHRHDVRPGLTGLAQVSGRNLLNWDDRFKKDLEYVDNISFLFDIKIILLTIKKVLFKEDIQMGEELHFSRLDIERGPKPTFKKITINDFRKNKSDLYDCILELKKNNSKESDKIIINMERYLNDKSAIIICPYVENKIVGFIWGYYLSNNKIHINYFSVLGKYRNNGFGTKLIKKIISDNKDSKLELLVNKDNSKAIKFYIKNGFTKEEYSEEKIKMIME